MSHRSHNDSGFQPPSHQGKQNWLAQALLPVMSSRPKTPAQRVVGAIVLVLSSLWIGVCVYIWFRLCAVNGVLQGIAGLLGLFFATVIPVIIVYSWLQSTIIRRYTLTKLHNHPELIASEMEATREKLAHMPQYMEEARKRGRIFGVVLATVCIAAAVASAIINGTHAADPNVHVFSKTPPVNLKRNPKIDYLDITSEEFYVYKPKSYTGTTPFGLIVYMSPSDSCGVPAGWTDVLEKRHLLFVAPQGVGNESVYSRRLGLGVMGALAMIQQYKVDPSRVYAAGLSGGARAANALGLYQPDLFKGTIQDCGADFYKTVAHNHTTNWTDSLGNSYGVLPDVQPADLAAAKSNVRFTLVTGPNDFRHNNLLDLYENGYKPGGFKCRMIDVPGMGHQDCNGETLNQTLDFIAGAR